MNRHKNSKMIVIALGLLVSVSWLSFVGWRVQARERSQALRVQLGRLTNQSMAARSGMERHTVAGKLSAGAAGTPLAAGLPMATITVTNTNDGSLPLPGSLRQAINNAMPGDTINFNLAGPCPCVITLTAGELGINKNLTITGLGADLLEISGNHASRIFNITAGNVTLSGLTIAHGQASGGGGILNNGTLSVSNCALSDNTSTADGGGIYNSPFATVNLTNSTLSSNRATGFRGAGGGIFNTTLATVNLTNSTISGNTAFNVFGFGGGIGNVQGGILNLTNCTLTGNAADTGGGIANDASVPGPVNIKNTIASGNTGFFDVFGVSNNLGNNLISVPNPGLAPLGYYGGPTQTHALLPGSPAIGAGDNVVTGAPLNLTTDQRGAGFNRQVGSAVDIGAFESRGFTLARAGGNNQSTMVTTAFANPLAVTVSSAFSEPVSGGLVTFTPLGSGASATFAGNPATLNGSGQASVMATANNQAGSYQVMAAASGAGSVNFNLTNTCPTLMVSPGTLPQGTAGTPYNQAVSASGGAVPYSFSATGLPTGLMMASNGAITGTPTQTGSFTVNVSVTDNNGCPGGGMVALTINCQTITVTAPAVNTGTASVPFSSNFTQTNGVGAVSFSLNSGMLPPGLSLAANGTLSGTPTQVGSFPLTVKVTDSNNCMGVSPTYTLVSGCPTFSLSTLPPATASVPYSQTISAQPADGNYSFAHTGGTLPPGLSLASNGTLSGTPATAGTFNFTVTATGFGGACSGDQTYSFTVSCPTVTLTPASLANGEVGTAYSQTITAQPAGGNYSFAVTNGALPPGLNLSAGGVISGTPAQTGVFNFRLTATGFGSCSGFRDYQIVVPGCAPITVGPATLVSGTVGAAYSQTLSALPNGGYNFAVTSGALPSGLSLNATSGVISGTPAQVGSYSFRISATLGGCTGFRDYTVVINCPVITIGALVNGTAGTSYSQTITVTPAGSYTFSLTQGSLPSGLMLNPSTGVLSGLPTMTGTYNFTVKAQAANGCNAAQAYVLALICPTVSLAPVSLPNGTPATTYNQAISANPAGGNYSYAVTTGSLPTGLNLNPSTGALSGTPTANGTFNFRITVSGFGSCTGFRDYTIVIGGGGCPAITLPASLPNSSVGQLYSNSVAAAPAGSYSYVVTTGSLPPGLTLYGVIGLIFGYPTANGTYHFTITATDNNTCTTSQNYTVVIGAGFLAKAGDFDGDGKADTAVFRGPQADWQVVQSSTNALQTQLWGAPGDQQAAGDYDGDGKLDLAVFTSSGHWRIKRSADGAVVAKRWGLSTDTPVPGDYDGDGKTDIAVWRGSEGIWYISNSSNGAVQTVAWGAAYGPYNDVAVPGDYDGDHKTDLAIFRQQDGTWHIKRSSDGTIVTKPWGLGTDVPVPGDYDGDGKTDIAVWRGQTSIWFIIRSGNGLLQMATLGASYTPYNDVPVPGDYDGDGKTDIAVWRPGTGTWYSLNSGDGAPRVRQHGQSGDTPVTGRP